MNLPPLPKPALTETHLYGGEVSKWYDKHQMRYYAAAAVAADREAICRLVYGHCGSDNDAQRIVDAIRAMK